MGFARQMRRRHIREQALAAAERAIDWTMDAGSVDPLDQHALDRMADDGGPVA